MWIRMGTFAVKPSEVERLKQTYNGVAVPKVRACPGNLACLLLEPASAGEAGRLLHDFGSCGHDHPSDGQAAMLAPA